MTNQLTLEFEPGLADRYKSQRARRKGFAPEMMPPPPHIRHSRRSSLRNPLAKRVGPP